MKPFYNEMLRKYTVVMGSLLNDFTIWRTDGTDRVNTFKVPLSYGPREKFLARLQQDPDLDRNEAITLPRITFDLLDIQLDTTRMKNRLNKVIDVRKQGNKNAFSSVWHAVPYDLTFQVSVIAKNVEDANRVVEQILPNFQPEWNVTVKLLDELPNHRLDVPIELVSVTPRDDYTADFKERRAVIWDMTFVMRAWIYGPAQQQKVIKVAKVNIYTDLKATAEYERVTVYPGMTANGQPTTKPEETISWREIEEDDNWDYIVTIESFPEIT